MRQRILALTALFLMCTMTCGVAGADEVRDRVGQQRPNGWGRQHAAVRPAIPVNVSTTAQQGRGNVASVVQTGTGNAAGIRQFGRDNVGAITQVGSGNTACLIQAGRNLDGAIQQVGDNQTNGLLQTRWGSSEIPVEVCATATTRADLMEYLPERPEIDRGRGRRALRGEP